MSRRIPLATHDSEGKSPTLCTHLKAVPLLICAASKIQCVQGVGEGGVTIVVTPGSGFGHDRPVGGLSLWISKGRTKRRV